MLGKQSFLPLRSKNGVAHVTTVQRAAAVKLFFSFAQNPLDLDSDVLFHIDLVLILLLQY